MCHQLIRFFGRRIQADRRVGGVRLGEPFPVAVAVDRAGRGEHEMRGRLCAASINEVLEADYIDIDRKGYRPLGSSENTEPPLVPRDAARSQNRAEQRASQRSDHQKGHPEQRKT